MTFLVRYFTKEKISESYTRVLGEKIMEQIGCKNSEVSLVFVGEKMIRKMNKTYRGIDRVTDVLSFGNESDEKDKFVSAGEDKGLGEIFICVKRAKKQAEEKGHSLKNEIGVLMIHGVLHLLGYDHEKDADAARMEKMERKLALLL